jgi:transcriptional regulator with XRE-family HTH domain
VETEFSGETDMGRQHDTAKTADTANISGQIAGAAQPSDVSQRLRQLRLEKGLSIRALAEASGLSANTLSLIENGKISPSVSTLHRAANALGVPITAFFEASSQRQQVVFLQHNDHTHSRFEHGAVEDLSTGFTSRALHPCLVTLEPHAGSGLEQIVHTGDEFVYCLQGRITYIVDERRYSLEPGDSLIFESHLPHRWLNESDSPAQMLLVLAPTDGRDRPTHRHFAPADPAP